MKKEQFLNITTTSGQPVCLNKRHIIAMEKYDNTTLIFMQKDQGYPDLVFETNIDYKILCVQVNDYDAD